MPPVAAAVSTREARRLETRARLFDAAVAEIGRTGLGGADVSAIARAVGVARGTFYFHFPTKEHVLAELQHSEEARIVAELEKRSSPPSLESALSDAVAEVLVAERRLGETIFREMLGLVFSSTRPAEAQLDEHPLADYVLGVLTRAQHEGALSASAQPRDMTVIFLNGMFALLTTLAASAGTRRKLLDQYVKTMVTGMEAL
ncbi:TetR/AcrR family transcriptional regulator [Mycobacterium neumannii]|uniref:TetR/AcrR family transcriptional regulator n=1 Tax=Mycobacterium neumannii TaxID=2048551 RepID=UPI003AB377D9